MRKITKKTRFEVFKRDSFTCQYCGKKAPEVILHIDHIHPIAEGGNSDLMNLLTSCLECNLGKGPRKISDNSVLDKQRQQLEELNERRIQLEMMLDWRKSLQELKDFEVNAIAGAINNCSVGYEVNESGKNNIRKWLKKYSLNEILDVVETSHNQYLKYQNGKPTHDSVKKAFDYIPKILINMKKGVSEDTKKLYYIRGILKNRINYVDERKTIKLLQDCLDRGACIEKLTNLSKEVKNWTEFKTILEDYIKNHKLKEQNDQNT